MKTITIQIGNSDDKLTQREWAKYVSTVHDLITESCLTVHFFGGSENYAEWINVCWVLAGSKSRIEYLRLNLPGIKKNFQQDSIAWTEGETKFI